MRGWRLALLRWPSVVCPCATGATWRLVVAKAPWAARDGHTTAIDATGAIYVLGGYTGGIYNDYYNDVRVSTDGGADALGGYLRSHFARLIMRATRRCTFSPLSFLLSFY